MFQRACLMLSCFSLMAVCLPAYADKPNLTPGMWAHTTTTTIQGPMSLEPQTSSNQECLTQAQIDKGVDMLEIPKQCLVQKVNVLRDTADFAVDCDIQGIKNHFIGHTNFRGDHMDGQMSSEMNSPMGTMVMTMNFSAKRIGACPAAK
ncbi:MULTISPECIES: DUF3617 domain-containing protein [unclassified Methylophaga]|uniref:DUF3617 domain-containing protein n=1 Tax=unclassified Methylophaga TaxID=2629249 RepID=UPI000C68D0EE|nr:MULTISPECIES: DUF3617 family protein [unclassified Methylophaga]MAX52392.1 hypothetical protein [Methylophaga sp.]